METRRNEQSKEAAERRRYAAPQVMEYGAVADLVRGWKLPYIEIEGNRDTIRV